MEYFDIEQNAAYRTTIHEAPLLPSVFPRKHSCTSILSKIKWYIIYTIALTTITTYIVYLVRFNSLTAYSSPNNSSATVVITSSKESIEGRRIIASSTPNNSSSSTAGTVSSIPKEDTLLGTSNSIVPDVSPLSFIIPILSTPTDELAAYEQHLLSELERLAKEDEARSLAAAEQEYNATEEYDYYDYLANHDY
jgi:hypothetical protein